MALFSKYCEQGGSSTQRVEVSYPIGHSRRREEGIPELVKKFHNAIAAQFSAEQAKAIAAAVESQADLRKMSVPAFVDDWVM